MPGRLRAVVCRGMEQVQAVLVEAQRAESVASSRKLNVLGEPLSLRRSCSDHQSSCFGSSTGSSACSLVLIFCLSAALAHLVLMDFTTTGGKRLSCLPCDIWAGTVAASLRGVFFESFASYAVGTDGLSQELSAKAPTDEEALEGEPLISGDRKLLVLLSNCAFVRGSIMPGLIDRCATAAFRLRCAGWLRHVDVRFGVDFITECLGTVLA